MTRRPVKHFPVAFRIWNEPTVPDGQSELAKAVIPAPKPTPVVLFPRDTNRKARRSRK